MSIGKWKPDEDEDEGEEDENKDKSESDLNSGKKRPRGRAPNGACKARSRCANPTRFPLPQIKAASLCVGT